jgi:hypothetical protein
MSQKPRFKRGFFLPDINSEWFCDVILFRLAALRFSGLLLLLRPGRELFHADPPVREYLAGVAETGVERG